MTNDDDYESDKSYVLPPGQSHMDITEDEVEYSNHDPLALQLYSDQQQEYGRFQSDIDEERQYNRRFGLHDKLYVFRMMREKSITREIYEADSDFEAVLFNQHGKNLDPASEDVKNSRVKFFLSIRMEEHMPHVRVCGNVLHSSSNQDINLAAKDTLPQCSNDISAPALHYTSLAQLDHILNILAASVHTYINFEGYRSIDITEFRDLGDPSPEATAALNRLKPKIRDCLLAKGKESKRLLLVEISFRPEHSCHLRTYFAVRPWARPLVEAIHQGRIVAIIAAGDLTLSKLIHIRKKLEAQQVRSPLNRFLSPIPCWENDHFTPMKSPLCHRSLYDYRLRYPHFSINEYLAIAGFHCIEKRKVLKYRYSLLAQSRNRIHLIPVSSSDETVYDAWIEASSAFDFYLQPGMKATVVFDKHTMNPEEWPARVLSRIHLTSSNIDLIQLRVTRPRLHGDHGFGFSRKKIRQFDYAGPGLFQVSSDILRRDRGHCIRLKLDSSELDREYENQRCALSIMWSGATNTTGTVWQHNIRNALLCNRLDLLPATDPFTPQTRLRPSFLAWENSLAQRHPSRYNVAKERNAPAGLMLMHASSRKDKSDTIRNMCKQFFLSEKNPLVIVLSPTAEEACDNEACLSELSTDLQSETSDPVLTYGLGIRSPTLDPEELDRLQHTAPIDSVDRARYKAMSNMYNEATTNVKLELMTLLEAVLEPDRPESVGHMMLELSGFTYGPRTRHASNNRFRVVGEKLKRLLIDLQSGEKLTLDDIRGLWRNTLSGAKFIVGTTTAISSYNVLAGILDRPVVLILTDATRQPRNQLLLIFAAPFKNVVGFIQIGDFTLAGSATPPSPSECIHVDWASVTIAEQLMAAGLPVYPP